MTALGLVAATVLAADAGAAAAPRFSAPVVNSTGSAIEAPLATDLNGDGKPDLVTAPSKVWVQIGKGDGSFHRRVAYRAASPSDVAAGDLNGDGRPDLIAVGETLRHTVITVLINDGEGRFHRDRVYASRQSTAPT
jgi:hypothetical protein